MSCVFLMKNRACQTGTEAVTEETENFQSSAFLSHPPITFFSVPNGRDSDTGVSGTFQSISVTSSISTPRQILVLEPSSSLDTNQCIQMGRAGLPFPFWSLLTRLFQQFEYTMVQAQPGCSHVRANDPQPLHFAVQTPNSY